eukprot:TRINITY_DN31603_c0_g3_i3.p1 TRINITY_DN31603_c0_g3~~TRINITY_DN31603_c0_g3_i3.p1  ORF type:complete len:1672 (-),score=378.29 TRINITY_DN31603_c0_g3_i3:122-5137(-)
MGEDPLGCAKSAPPCHSQDSKASKSSPEFNEVRLFDEFEHKHAGLLQRRLKKSFWRDQWRSEWFVVSPEFLVSYTSKTSWRIESCLPLSCIHLAEACGTKRDGGLFRVQYTLQETEDRGHKRKKGAALLEQMMKAEGPDEATRWVTTILEARRRMIGEQNAPGELQMAGHFVPLAVARHEVRLQQDLGAALRDDLEEAEGTAAELEREVKLAERSSALKQLASKLEGCHHRVAASAWSTWRYFAWQHEMKLEKFAAGLLLLRSVVRRGCRRTMAAGLGALLEAAAAEEVEEVAAAEPPRDDNPRPIEMKSNTSSSSSPRADGARPTSSSSMPSNSQPERQHRPPSQDPPVAVIASEDEVNNKQEGSLASDDACAKRLHPAETLAGSAPSSPSSSSGSSNGDAEERPAAMRQPSELVERAATAAAAAAAVDDDDEGKEKATMQDIKASSGIKSVGEDDLMGCLGESSDDEVSMAGGDGDVVKAIELQPAPESGAASKEQMEKEALDVATDFKASSGIKSVGEVDLAGCLGESSDDEVSMAGGDVVKAVELQSAPEFAAASKEQMNKKALDDATVPESKDEDAAGSDAQEAADEWLTHKVDTPMDCGLGSTASTRHEDVHFPPITPASEAQMDHDFLEGLSDSADDDDEGSSSFCSEAVDSGTDSIHDSATGTENAGTANLEAAASSPPAQPEPRAEAPDARDHSLLPLSPATRGLSASSDEEDAPEGPDSKQAAPSPQEASATSFWDSTPMGCSPDEAGCPPAGVPVYSIATTPAASSSCSSSPSPMRPKLLQTMLQTPQEGADEDESERTRRDLSLLAKTTSRMQFAALEEQIGGHSRQHSEQSSEGSRVGCAPKEAASGDGVSREAASLAHRPDLAEPPRLGSGRSSRSSSNSSRSSRSSASDSTGSGGEDEEVVIARQASTQQKSSENSGQLHTMAPPATTPAHLQDAMEGEARAGYATVPSSSTSSGAPEVFEQLPQVALRTTADHHAEPPCLALHSHAVDAKGGCRVVEEQAEQEAKASNCLQADAIEASVPGEADTAALASAASTRGARSCGEERAEAEQDAKETACRLHEHIATPPGGQHDASLTLSADDGEQTEGHTLRLWQALSGGGGGGFKTPPAASLKRSPSSRSSSSHTLSGSGSSSESDASCFSRSSSSSGSAASAGRRKHKRRQKELEIRKQQEMRREAKLAERRHGLADPGSGGKWSPQRKDGIGGNERSSPQGPGSQPKRNALPDSPGRQAAPEELDDKKLLRATAASRDPPFEAASEQQAPQRSHEIDKFEPPPRLFDALPESEKGKAAPPLRLPPRPLQPRQLPFTDGTTNEPPRMADGASAIDVTPRHRACSSSAASPFSVKSPHVLGEPAKSPHCGSLGLKNFLLKLEGSAEEFAVAITSAPSTPSSKEGVRVPVVPSSLRALPAPPLLRPSTAAAVPASTSRSGLKSIPGVPKGLGTGAAGAQAKQAPPPASAAPTMPRPFGLPPAPAAPKAYPPAPTSSPGTAPPPPPRPAAVADRRAPAATPVPPAASVSAPAAGTTPKAPPVAEPLLKKRRPPEPSSSASTAAGRKATTSADTSSPAALPWGKTVPLAGLQKLFYSSEMKAAAGGGGVPGAPLPPAVDPAASLLPKKKNTEVLSAATSIAGGPGGSAGSSNSGIPRTSPLSALPRPPF